MVIEKPRHRVQGAVDRAPFEGSVFVFADGVAQMAPAARAHALIWRGAEGLVRMFQRLWRDRSGALLIDYTILVALITVIVVVGVSVAGSWIHGMWARLLPILG